MELFETIRNLVETKRKLELAISTLEALADPETDPSPLARTGRGGKSMGPEERQEVSVRMKRYWRRRRQDGAAL